MSEYEGHALRERLKDIKQREQAATGSAWHFHGGVDGFYIASHGRELGYFFGDAMDDARFAAHAREDIPWLLDFAKQLQNEKAALATRVHELEERLLALGGDTRRRE